jgi:two-component system CheB/CheR fusion protein
MPTDDAHGSASEENSQQPDRLAEPVSNEQPPRLPFVVVGIGASAGGLEACSEFFLKMPTDTGMAFVLVQHLAPDHESMLAEILATKTAMQVVQVADGMAVEPNRVHVIRPGHTLTIREGKLRLGPRLKDPANNRPIDDFFRSLAEEQRERSVCVILSGMGSNGTAGAKAIKVVGGICIAQEPESASQPSMPGSMISAGYADFILRPGAMADVLVSYARHPYVREHGGKSSVHTKSEILEILTILRVRTKRDFSPYKLPTIQRRIQRRMGVTRQQTVEDYAAYLRQHPPEATLLADDLLIHVTGFFRDPAAWEQLQARVIAPLIAECPAGSEVRCWVAACSSGEESYSLAMLLQEASDQADKSLSIKVFATDTAQRTLTQARNGIYPGGIETEVSPQRLERFFDKESAVYRVKKALRERVIFAPQNLVEDPPYSRLDIITCRNLLIYLEPEVQRRILAMLHFALREGGYLFLGASETIAGCEELFEPVDRNFRIYRRVGPARFGAFPFHLPRDFIRLSAGEPVGAAKQQPSLSQQMQHAMLQRHTPAAVVVDREFRILFYHGDTNAFLLQPAGEPTRELLSVVREELRGAVRGALHQALAGKEIARAKEAHLSTAHGIKHVEIMVELLDSHAPDGPLLVSFQQRPAPVMPAEAARAGDENQLQLVDELRRTQDELQSTVEELQSSNEELKTSNEEVRSVNEELQATNEELEASKEEMQSLNEELSTVNSQLQAKNEELERTGSNLSCLLSSTNIAVIFLDKSFQIRSFTPATRDLFDLLATDVGRPLRDMNRKFIDESLLTDAAMVLQRLSPVEKEIKSESGKHYLRRIWPYRTTEDRIDGIVITFVDVTDRKKFEQELSRAKLLAENSSHSKDQFLAMLSHELRTPLTPITLAIADIQREKDLPIELRNNLEMIQRNLALEMRLIDDLLDLSRVISGKMRLKCGPLGVHRMLTHALQTMAAEVNAKHVTIEFHLEAANDIVSADEPRLQQVFLNILRNSVKFTLAGGKILLRSWNQHNEIVVQIEDSGIGIEASEMARLFEPFEQGNLEKARQAGGGGGMGLGLAIARSVTELHGGQIRAKSEGKGKGATFVIELPLMPDGTQRESAGAGAEAHMQQSRAKRVSPKSVKILLVEDHIDTASIMMRLLKQVGYSVEHAGSASQAVQIAAKHPPDILLSDLNLPDGSGHDLIRQIKQSHRVKGIAVSGLGTDEDIRHSHEAGFAEHITKPIHFSNLLEVIERVSAS